MAMVGFDYLALSLILQVSVLRPLLLRCSVAAVMNHTQPLGHWISVAFHAVVVRSRQDASNEHMGKLT